jgi:hypothetical protein
VCRICYCCHTRTIVYSSPVHPCQNRFSNWGIDNRKSNSGVKNWSGPPDSGFRIPDRSAGPPGHRRGTYLGVQHCRSMNHLASVVLPNSTHIPERTGVYRSRWYLLVPVDREWSLLRIRSAFLSCPTLCLHDSIDPNTTIGTQVVPPRQRGPF